MLTQGEPKFEGKSHLKRKPDAVDRAEMVTKREKTEEVLTEQAYRRNYLKGERGLQGGKIDENSRGGGGRLDTREKDERRVCFFPLGKSKARMRGKLGNPKSCKAIP